MLNSNRSIGLRMNNSVIAGGMVTCFELIEAMYAVSSQSFLARSQLTIYFHLGYGNARFNMYVGTKRTRYHVYRVVGCLYDTWDTALQC